MLNLAVLHGQFTPVHLSNKGIYGFLDELATQQVIDLNSAIKPYSRSLITEKLREAELNRDQLTKRQIKELQFYLKDYGTNGRRHSLGLDQQAPEPTAPFFQYRDSLFQIAVNPILGGNLWSNDSSSFTTGGTGLKPMPHMGISHCLPPCVTTMNRRSLPTVTI